MIRPCPVVRLPLQKPAGGFPAQASSASLSHTGESEGEPDQPSAEPGEHGGARGEVRKRVRKAILSVVRLPLWVAYS